MHNEDFDIKIFSPIQIKKAEKSEPVIIVDEMKRQVVSGNLQKAKKLGEMIASSFHEAAEKEELWTMASQCCIPEPDRRIKDQAIILSVFTAEYVFTHYISDPLLSTTAITTLYDTLTKQAPELYGNLLASTAFSFYYMNLEGKETAPDIIGKTFAVLCDDDDNENLLCYGKTVFITSLENFKKAVESVDFCNS